MSRWACGSYTYKYRPLPRIISPVFSCSARTAGFHAIDRPQRRNIAPKNSVHTATRAQDHSILAAVYLETGDRCVELHASAFPVRAKNVAQHELVETDTDAVLFDVTSTAEAGSHRATNYRHWGISPYYFQKLCWQDIANSLKAVAQTARPKLVQEVVEAGPAVYMRAGAQERAIDAETGTDRIDGTGAAVFSIHSNKNGGAKAAQGRRKHR